MSNTNNKKPMSSFDIEGGSKGKGSSKNEYDKQPLLD